MATNLANTVSNYQVRVDRRSRATALSVVMLSLLTAWLFFAFPPGWPAVILCAAAAFVVATWYRPVLGIASVLSVTILVEQYDFALFRPITRLVPLFDNLSGVTSLQGLDASALELLLVAVTLVVVTQLALKKLRVRPNPLTGPVAAFLAAIALWLPYGLLSGGTLNVALWELRAVMYFCLLVLIVPQAIVSERDIHILLWASVLAVGIKAAQGVWNYVVVLGGDLSGVRSVTGHEDALFIAWMIVFLAGLLMYKTGSGQRVALLLASPVMAVTFVATDRRAAYAALALGLVVLAALVMSDRERRVLLVKGAIPVLLVALFVIAAGWNNSGPIGLPAQVIKSISAPSSKEDVDSSYYRRAEEVNLMHAVESSPILGLGFGRPFQAPGQGGIVDVGFTLENVIPHNEIMWIWAKMGTIGFGLFWVMVGGVIALGGLTFRTTRQPYLKVVSGLVCAAVAMQVVVSYVDLQLTYARNMVFLGVLVAVLARIPALAEEDSVSAPD
jgi:hypothetical protein